MSETVCYVKIIGFSYLGLFIRKIDKDHSQPMCYKYMYFYGRLYVVCVSVSVCAKGISWSIWTNLSLLSIIHVNDGTSSVTKFVKCI